MTGAGYGGYVWQSQETTQYEDYRSRGLSLAVFAGVAGAAGLAATHTLLDGTRAIDKAYYAATLVGDASPGSVLNTFRTAEWLSPFVSAKGLGLSEATYSWEVAQLGDSSTYEYLKLITGKSDSELGKLGIVPGLDGEEDIGLDFVRQKDSHRGDLFVRRGKKRELISRDIALMQATPEDSGLFNTGKKINPAASSIFNSLGITNNDWFDPEKVFRPNTPTGEQPKFIPIPSVTGSLDSLADLKNRTAYLRAFPAFGMERLNTLLEGVAGQVPFVGELAEGFDKAVGLSTKVRSGTSIEMFARFGKRAAAIGAVGIGVSTLDWARRNFDSLGTGHLAVSGIMSGGLAYGLARAGKSPTTAMAAGVASFFGQVVLPGFDQGIVPGLATAYTKATVLRASISPFNWQRRAVEGFLPGVSGLEVGVLAGIAAVAATTMPLYKGKRLPDILLDHMGPESFGIAETVKVEGVEVPVRAPKTVSQEFWSSLEERARQTIPQQEFINWKNSSAPTGLKRLQLARLVRASKEFAGDHPGGWMGQWNEIRNTAEAVTKKRRESNPLNVALAERLEKINEKYAGKTDWSNRAMRSLEGMKETIKHSVLGADPTQANFARRVNKVGFNPKLGRVGIIFSMGFLAHGLATGSLLGSMETADELDAMYRGRKLVEVRKSRFWEAGGTPFEGDQISYYRPHWYHLMMNRTRQRGLWGGDEDSISPIGKFLRKNFTYQWEKENYYDRPYPVTGAAFQDVPIIGNVLAATVGRLFKPARLMHTDEWIRSDGEGGYETADVFKGSRNEPSYLLGAYGSGLPTTPLSTGRVLGETISQFREMEGLTGWAKNVVSNVVLGDDTYGDERAVLASANQATSWGRSFWEAQTGGAVFTNEALRRFFPNPGGTDSETINPIMNSMPSWIPDKFRYGDPYAAIEWGEARLPGAGYASLFPELEGVDPEAYPLIHRYKILADVAMHSTEFRHLRQQMYSRRAEGQTTQSENQAMDYIDSLVAERMNQYSFERTHKNASVVPGASVTQGVWFGTQQLFRDLVAPGEFLIPMGFRPAQKLLHDRDPLEQYEYERLYGTKMAFWDKPWRDWFRPSLYSAAHMMGFEGKPLWRSQADKTNEYFDKLEFVKWMRIAEQAEMQGDHSAKSRALYKANSTRAGINPMGNAMGIYWTLPDEEKRFFNAFANAQGSERDRILEMIPSDQVQLYQTIWARLDAGGDSNLFAGAEPQIDEQYMLEQYARITAELGNLPDDDWIGYHADVDMDDVRVRYVNNMGKDLHDYGLWENQLRKSERQPFLDGSTAQLNHRQPLMHRAKVASGLEQMTRGHYQSGNFSVHTGGTPYGKLVWNDNREPETLTLIRSALGF